MPLFLNKHFFAGAVLCALFWLTCPSVSWALEGQVTERAAFCLTAEKKCSPIFYLNPSDSLKILRQSLDEEWYFVRYTKTQQEGWVSAQFVKLRLPEKLKSEQVAIPPDVQALHVQKEQLQLISLTHITPLGSEQAVQKLTGLKPFLPASQSPWVALASEKSDLMVLGVTETEQSRFVQVIKPGLTPYPEYNTLVGIENIQDFKGAALSKNEELIILAKGTSPWGINCLSVLDAQFIPLFLFPEDRTLLSYLPQDLINVIRPESFKLLSLDQEGVLLATAYHSHKRQKVLVILHYDLKEVWIYEGLYHWPEDIPLKPETPNLKVRALKQGEHFFLLLDSDDDTPGFLAFYAGKSDPVTVQPFKEKLTDAVFFKDELWTLHKNHLLHWSPVYAP